MALILNIETATKTCSVALAKDGQLVAIKEHHGEYSHAENLTFFIKNLLEESNVIINDIDAIAVSQGPGSYTGLRIGVSTAKGLCFVLNKPLLAVNTLQAMANNLNNYTKNSEYLLCPMIDARRMEVYCAIFDHKLNTIKQTSAEIIDYDSFTAYSNTKKILFFGDGAPKCKTILGVHSNSEFLTDYQVSAKGMIEISEQLFLEKKFEDIAYFEPFYLKDFVTTTPKKLL